MQQINLLSYNLKSNVAYPELANLITAYDVEILCLQECDKDNLAKSLAGLVLTAQTTTGTLGLAIYSRPEHFSVIQSVSIPVNPSVYEQLYIQDRERLLVVELLDHTSNRPLFVASFHATHLIATNHLRRKQFRFALQTLNSLKGEHPAVLVGDFNYPFFHKRLLNTAADSNFKLIIPDAPTFHGRGINGKFDMVASAQLLTKLSVLPFGLSDHTPILVRIDSNLPMANDATLPVKMHR